MKIIFDARVLTRGGLSGIEEYARNLLKTLLAVDSANRYFLFYSGLRKQPLNYQLPITNYQSLKIIDWKIPNKIFEVSSRFLSWPKLDRFIEADLIFSPHFNILAKTETPRVITFHDLSFLRHPYFFSQKQKFWHWLQNYKKQAQEAAKIIAVSEFTKSDLVNLLAVPEEKISVIYSGVDDQFKKMSADDRRLKDFRGKHKLDSPFILYLGTLEPRKNIPAIIRAFNALKSNPRFKDLKLILAGRPGWLYQNIANEIGKSSYGKDIALFGPVSGEDRVLLYNLAEVFIYPSFFEGFGFPPLEAQACGCPVIAADRASLPEILGQSAILIDPSRVEE